MFVAPISSALLLLMTVRTCPFFFHFQRASFPLIWSFWFPQKFSGRWWLSLSENFGSSKLSPDRKKENQLLNLLFPSFAQCVCKLRRLFVCYLSLNWTFFMYNIMQCSSWPCSRLWAGRKLKNVDFGRVRRTLSFFVQRRLWDLVVISNRWNNDNWFFYFSAEFFLSFVGIVFSEEFLRVIENSYLPPFWSV